MLHKWNDKCVTFWEWFLLLSIILDIHPSCCTYKKFILFYCWIKKNIPQFSSSPVEGHKRGRTYHNLAIHLLRDTWVASNLGLYTNIEAIMRFLSQLVYVSLGWVSRGSFAGSLVVAYLVSKETPKLFSIIALPFYTSPNNVWVIYFFCILSSIAIQHY